MNGDSALKKASQAFVATLIEEHSADAVIIAVTRRRKRGTQTFVLPFGNAFAYRGLAEFVYASLCEDGGDEDDDEAEDCPDGAE